MVGDGVAVVELDGAVVIGNSPVWLALGAVGHATVVIGQRVVLVVADRRIEDGDGAIVVSLVVIEMAQRLVGGRIFRVELDGLLEVLQGAVGVAAVAQGEAAIEIGVGLLGIELDRFVEVANGAFSVAVGAAGDAAGDQRRGDARLNSGGLGRCFGFQRGRLVLLRCFLLCFGAACDHGVAARNALIGGYVGRAFALLDLVAGNGERGWCCEQHECRCNQTSDEVSGCLDHTASSFRFAQLAQASVRLL